MKGRDDGMAALQALVDASARIKAVDAMFLRLGLLNRQLAVAQTEAKNTIHQALATVQECAAERPEELTLRVSDGLVQRIGVVEADLSTLERQVAEILAGVEGDA